MKIKINRAAIWGNLLGCVVIGAIFSAFAAVVSIPENLFYLYWGMFIAMCISLFAQENMEPRKCMKGILSSILLGAFFFLVDLYFALTAHASLFSVITLAVGPLSTIIFTAALARSLLTKKLSPPKQPE
ncbi:MAG: hypothetical protein GC185_08640 [Alphaproteobacteria bacterium]|nr:hypothetical protein [Alphaproteobacteria bacterium]